MKQVFFTEANPPASFADFIQSFGNSEQDNEVLLNPNIGTGSIRFINIEQGLQLRLWDCTFNNGLEIFRQAKEEKENRTFTVVYYLTPSSVLLEDSRNTASVINSLWNNVLLSSDAVFKVKILPGQPLRCVSLNLSADWIRKNVLCDISRHNHLLHRFAVSATPFVIFESLSALEKKLTEGIFDVKGQVTFGKFFWRSKVLNIMTAFFSKLVNRLSHYHGVERYHEEQMAEVEKDLTDNIYNGLPDIKSLARKVAVSESTLKRYFRRIYGKNIYSYFLEKRMICARRLLTEKRKTVSEAATIMGYESVSQFSNTFKRFFGMLPGTLRKISVAPEINWH